MRRIARFHNSCYRQHKERHDTLRRATRYALKRVAKVIEVEGGIFDNT